MTHSVPQDLNLKIKIIHLSIGTLYIVYWCSNEKNEGKYLSGRLQTSYFPDMELCPSTLSGYITCQSGVKKN